MANSTITLLQTMEWAKQLNFNRRSALGNFLEPALTCANLVKQTIMGAPFEWRWNRAELQWSTINRTEVWAANNAYPLNYRIKDSNGNMQMVTSIGSAPHQSGSSVPTWSTDTAGNGTTLDGDLTWTVSDINTYIISNPTLGWIQNCNVYDAATQKWMEVQPQSSLALDTSLARPRYISADIENDDGTVEYVFIPTPDKVYPVTLQFQEKPALFTSINQTWAPIPDYLSYIYNWGFLALMWLFADDPRFAAANQKFVASLLAANEGLTEVERNMFLGNWGAITNTQVQRENQGVQARGL